MPVEVFRRPAQAISSAINTRVRSRPFGGAGQVATKLVSNPYCGFARGLLTVQLLLVLLVASTRFVPAWLGAPLNGQMVVITERIDARKYSNRSLASDVYESFPKGMH